MPIPVDNKHKILIIIPTVAKPSVLIPSFDLLCRRLDGLAVHVVLSINPLVPEDGERSTEECARLWEAYRHLNQGSHLSIYNHGKPAGFGGAINLGLRLAMYGDPITKWAGENCDYIHGLPSLAVIWNDDLRVTDGWLKSMLEALESEVVEDWAEFPNPDTLRRPMRSMADYIGTKSIGLIGPMTNCAAGIQQIPPESVERYQEVGPERFAVEWRETFEGSVLTCNFLSGYCMGITRQCIEEISVYDEDGRFDWLFDERYLIAGYEDNDLCVRADLAGFRAVVDASTFIGHIGHQTFDAAFPEMDRGMRNRLIYYEKWLSETQKQGQNITGIYRIKLDVPNDVDMLRMSLVRHGSLLDSVAILLTGNPGDVLKSPEAQQLGIQGLISKLGEKDYAMLAACADMSPSAIPRLFEDWAGGWLAKDLPSAKSRKPFAACALWHGEFNERDERNRLIGFAENLGSDWMISIDHDEAIEPRITRGHLERLMHHPDPLVGSWDLAFVNHWENNRMYRIDTPWGDGGSWTGGMRGYRMFKVNKVNPRRILAGGHKGLHCGNIPGTDWSTKRVAGMRIRHFGYMHAQDRYRKERRYNVQDPNPDPLLVGGTSYAHITDDTEMTLSPFVAETGIGMHMLLHPGESPDDLGRILDQVYGLIDRAVLVWTDPGEGPSPAMASMAGCFGAAWLYQPLNNDIASARNAGIEALHGTPGMGWSWFCDPDEHLPANGPVIMRRMAEAPDCWGWMFRFINKMAGQDGNWSESVRMARLDSEKLMRLSGRVHESFSPAIKELRRRGLGRILRVAPDPLVIINTGLARSPAEMQRKLEFYRLLSELDLKENPNNAGGWVTLGLYWANQGAMRAAEECFTRGVLCSDQEYLPYQELALLYSRRAKMLFHEAASRMGGHRMRSSWEKLSGILEKAAPEMPKLGSAVVDGFVPVEDQEALSLLPPFNP